MSSVVIEVPEALANRLHERAAKEGITVEQKAVQLLQGWAQQHEVSVEEFHAQVEIAREELERYRNTFGELSR